MLYRSETVREYPAVIPYYDEKRKVYSSFSLHVVIPHMQGKMLSGSATFNLPEYHINKHPQIFKQQYTVSFMQLL